VELTNYKETCSYK